MTKFETISSVTALISIGVAVWAWNGATNLSEESNKLNKEGIYLTTLNARINTCTTLADYHKDNAKGDAANSESSDGVKTESSSAKRSERSANIARALILCLVEDTDIEPIRKCVDRANNAPSHYVIDIIKYGSDGAKDELKEILAC